jgi:hypothetical protein
MWATGRPIQLSSTMTTRPWIADGAVAFLDDDRVLVYGGRNGTFNDRLNDLWLLDLSGSGNATLLNPGGVGPALGATAYHFKAAFDPPSQRFFVAGGWGLSVDHRREVVFLDTSDLFSPTLQWSPPQLMRAKRTAFGLQYVESSRYAYALFGKAGAVLSSPLVEVLDLSDSGKSLNFSASGTPPEPRQFVSTLFVGNSRIVILGGHVNANGPAIWANDTVNFLDLSPDGLSGTWGTPSSFPPVIAALGSKFVAWSSINSWSSFCRFGTRTWDPYPRSV